MRGRSIGLGLGLALAACGGDDGMPSNLSGPVVTVTAASTVGVSSTAGDDDTADDDGDDDGSSTAEPGTADASDTAATEDGGSSGSSTSGSEPVGMGTLGECITPKVWTSCIDYCAALDQTCQYQGCDGGTVHYFGTGPECSDQTDPMIDPQSCMTPLQMNGSVSFARCCCG